MTAVQTEKVKRLDEAGLTRLVGAAAVTTLRNRTRGGQSGYKGFRYEHFFSSHRIATLVKELCEEGRDAAVEWQSNSFIDDFVVRRDEERAFEGSQLKNSDQVSWVAGTPSIESDFITQRQVCCEENYAKMRLQLVCSSATTVAALEKAMPATVAEYSEVKFFPYGRPFLELIAEHAWLSEDFGYLSNRAEPTSIDVSQVISVFMGAWDWVSPTARVSEVFKKARDTSPGLVRTFESDQVAEEQLTPAFREAVAAIPDFEYVILKGFLQWTAAGGSTSGILPYDCFDDRFRRLQQFIVKLQPGTFEDIEGALA